MGHRFNGEVPAQSVDDPQRPVARTPAGAVSDRDERRPEVLQGRHGLAKEDRLRLVGFWREELKGNRRPGTGVQVGNAQAILPPLAAWAPRRRPRLASTKYTG